MYNVEVFRAYVPALDRDTGKEITIPVMVRRMFLSAPLAIGDSGQYRVSCTIRRDKDGMAALQHTISVLPRKKQPWWTNPQGKSEVWYTLGEEYVRLDNRTYNTKEIARWLGAVMGEEIAEAALTELHEGVELTP